MASIEIQARFARVSARLRQTERKYMSPREISSHLPDEPATIYFSVDKHCPVYRSSQLVPLYDTIAYMCKATKLDLSQVHAADLGSGLGASSIVFSYFCRKVTGFETFKPFVHEARGIAREMGYQNIMFSHRDFLDADLSGYKLWYLYLPFQMDFADLMIKKISEASAGTVIVSQTAFAPEVFEKGTVKGIYPVGKDFMTSSFCVLLKT